MYRLRGKSRPGLGAAVLTLPLLALAGWAAWGAAAVPPLPGNAPAAAATGPRPAAAAGIHLTGLVMSVNGQTQVPVGLFGSHASPLSKETCQDWGVEALRQIYQIPPEAPVVPGARHRFGETNQHEAVVPDNIQLFLECWWDRYQPAWQLTEPLTWREKLERLARDYGRKAKLTGREHHLEFWNEPFVNWPKNPGVNQDGTFFEQADTTPGKPMTVRHAREPSKWLVWDSPQLRATDVETGAVSYLCMRWGPKTIEDSATGETRAVRDGDVVTFRERKYKLTLTPWGQDPTWSYRVPGRQNEEFYRQMFQVFGKALKEANPEVRIVAGWGMHLHGEDWQAWEVMNKPTVDACMDWIDGLNEHHYGGDQAYTYASYEVINAYTQITYGRKLRYYNTEAGLSASPRERKPGLSPEDDDLDYGRRWLTYMLRDLVLALDVTPDLAFTRFEHEPHNKIGSPVAFKLFKPLRGALVYCPSALPRVWSVAACQERRMTAVLWNDGEALVSVPVAADAPAGTSFTAARVLWADVQDRKLVLAEKALPAGGRRWEKEIKIAPRSAVTLVFDLDARPSDRPVLRQTRYLAKVVRQAVAEGGLETTVSIPAAELKKARAASLRLVMDGANPRSLEVRINDQEVALIGARGALHDQPLALDALKAENTIRFTARGGGRGMGRGAVVGMVGIVLSTQESR